MKIIALIGSPRREGNTEILVEQVLEGCRIKGHEVEKIRLYDHEILPCLDCRRCKKGSLICPLDDGMKAIYDRLEEADAIVFGTPIYWYGPTAKMKQLIDRLRPFIANGKLKGKAGLVVVPSEEGPSCCGPLMEMFRMSFDYLGMTFKGSVLAKAYEKGEVREHPEELEEARALGFGIAD